MEVYSLVYSMLSTIPFCMLYWFVYRRWYRFNVSAAMIMLISLYIFEYGYLSRASISQENMAWIHLLLFLLELIPMRREMLTRTMIASVFFNFLYNVVGTIVMLIFVNTYTIITGASNQTWLATTNNTPMDYIFRYMMMPIAGGISCYITYKIAPLLEQLTKTELFWIAMGLIAPMLAFETFKRLAIKSADDYYGGFVIVGYGLLLLVMGTSCILCVLITTFRIGAEKKEMQIRMELQSSQYEEICRLQDGIRELRHDLVNHMAAGALSTDGIFDIVENFRKVCL